MTISLRRLGARASALLLLTVLLGLLSPASASAAPSNDRVQGAKVIGTIPYVDTMDTTTATTGAQDAKGCSPLGETHSVWYRYTPATTRRLTLDARGSYTVALAIFVRSPTGLQREVCDATKIENFHFVAGRTYYVMASDTGFSGVQEGGTFTLRVRPPLRTGLQIDSEGTVSHATGEAVIRGSVTCSRRVTSVNVFARVRQRISDTALAEGFAQRTFTTACTPGAPAAFALVVDPEVPTPFKAGRAGVVSTANVCNDIECATSEEVRVIVTLRWVA